MSSDTVSPAYTASPAEVNLPSYSSFTARAAPRLSRRIDTRKLKTKMCAYVLRGKRCPYGDNCAFAHEAKEAPQPLTSPMSHQTLHSLTSDESLVSDDSRTRSGDDEEDTITIIPGTSVDMPVATASLPPPPSYEEVVGAQTDVEGLVPPSYPTRFRYNPYSYEGVMFVN